MKKNYLKEIIEFLKGSTQVDLEKLKNHKVLYKYLFYIKPYRKFYLLMCLAMVITITVSLVQPLFYKHLVDDVLADNFGKSSLSLLVMYIFILVFLRIISIFSGVYKQIWDGKIIYAATADLEKDVYKKIQKLPMSYFDHHTGGDLLPRLYNDPDVVIGALVNLLPSIIEMCLRSIVILGIIISIIWWAGVLALVPLIPITVIGLWNMRYFKAFSDKIFRFQQNLYNRVLDTFDGIRIVRVFNKESSESQRFESLQDELLYLQLENNKRTAWLSPIIGTIGRLGGLIIFLAGSVAIVMKIPYRTNQPFTLGLLFMLLSYVWQLAAPISRIGRIAHAYGEAIASAIRLEELFSVNIGNTTLGSMKNRSFLSGNSPYALKCENVSFRYRKDKQVLKNISMEIKKGEIVGLIGPSGSGKTTLVNLICGLYPIEYGKILIQKNDPSIALALQQPHLFQGTIRATLTYAKPEASEKEVWDTLTCVLADDFVRILPKGLDTPIGSGSKILSAGQEQRIALARALMSSAPILIFDEATSWIDLWTEKEIWKNIRRKVKGKTILFISHRVHLMPSMDCVYIMRNGTIIDYGNHEVLMRKNRYYQMLFTFNKDLEIE